MIQSYLFNITQLLYVENAMELITTYRPNGKTPVQVAGMVTASRGFKDVYLEKLTLRDSGQAGLRLAQVAGHAAVVKVYAIMKSVYTPDALTMEPIVRLPKGDNTPSKTAARMGATAKLWATLPNPPGQATPFTAGGLTLVQFEALTLDLTTTLDACVECDQTCQKAGADLRFQGRANRAFITAALVQGRAQFPPGSWERELIDAIPTEAPQQLPAQAEITLAESTAPGAVHLVFDATHATSFQVWQKGPEQSEFVLVGEVIRPGGEVSAEYSATDLPSGAYEYQVLGVNSRGEGPASEPSAVAVGGALPLQANIGLAESQAEGAVHLLYDAEGATSFQVWHKGPGQSQFTQVDTTVTGEYLTFGLPGGMHAYKVVGVNAAGAGPASEPVSLEVEQAAAA